MGRDILTRVSEEENEPRTSEKLTKSQANKTFKPIPKRQNEVESTKALITKLISLFEKNWEEDQTSAFLINCKRKEDEDSNRANFTTQDLLYILVAVIQKANTANLSNFSFITQINIEELETYEQAMNRSYV